MNVITLLDTYQVVQLDKEFASSHAHDLALMADQIPLIEYTSEHILAEEKPDRKFLGKWGHSLAVLDHNMPVAFLMAYERQAEANGYYPNNSIYISELAVEKQYQGKGIAKKLLAVFLKRAAKEGYNHLKGPIMCSVQTNNADWNTHVQKLYEDAGFTKTGEKQYANRTDTIYYTNLT